jgi:hypothetical protein
MRTETEIARRRCYKKAARRGLTLKVRRKVPRGESRYSVYRGPMEVWWADCIGEVERYLKKAAPSDWAD